MATIVTRAGKGSPLTNNEVDANFTNLNSDKLESGDTVASLTITTADINGGTIDGVTIGGASAGAGTFSSLVATTADINGGTIDGVTLGTNSAVTEAQIDNLNINGNAIISTDTNGNITLTPNGTGEVDISKVDIDGGTIDGTVIGGSTPAAISGTTITATGDVDIADKIVHTGDTNTAIRFPTADTVTVETAGSERMRIHGSGNVGIGTSSPAATLQVSTGGTSTTPQANVVARFVTNGSNADAHIQFSNGVDHSANIGIAGGANLYFASDGTERMRIDASGNLLVGTLSAAGKITVSYVGSSGFGSSWNSTTTTGYALVFNTSSGQAGNIYVDTTTTAYNTSSDYRLKEDVQPMVGSVDRLMALKPINFAWKANGSRVDGFFAHEAQEVVPEAVTGEKDGEEMQAIDHSKLVPLLTAALQEALTEIADLKARLNALEGQ